MIAMYFLLFGGFLMAEAIGKLITKDDPKSETSLIILSGISLGILIPAGILKWRLAVWLDSVSINKEAVCTAMVGIINGGIILSASVFLNYRNVWYIDGIVTLVCSTALVGYALYTLIRGI